MVGDKIPHLHERFDACMAAFPEARWIYMLRDIHGVASSWNVRAQDARDTWPQRNDYRRAVEVWNDANRQVAALPPEQVKIIAYETFFGGDIAARDALFAFIGITPNRMFARHIRKLYAAYAEVVSRKTPLVLEGQAAHLAAHADMETFHALAARAD